jgi:prepilin-type N-terminal cleavage/methylation domain-containing protein
MARQNRRNGRRGFTLIEVLLAASITAAACTVATMLIQSISQTASASSGKYAGVVAARDSLSCIDMLVEEAALIGYWDGSRVLLWRNDDNGDGQINLSELMLVRYDVDSQKLSLRDVPVSGAQNTAVPFNQFVVVTAAQAVEQHANLRVRQMVGNLSAFAAWCDGIAGNVQAVQVTLTVESGDDAQTLHALMTLRSRTREKAL